MRPVRQLLPRPSRRTTRAAVALLAVAIASPLAWTASATGAAAPTTSTTKPVQLPVTSKPLPNSMRGQYAWSGQATSPADWHDVTPDLYYRDQVPWSRIETTQGSYDWNWFDAGMDQARAAGGRFGFRVLTWCPGCFDNQYTHDWTQSSWTPSYLPKQAGTDIPDWNSEAFLSGWEDLMHHIAERYADDPALGWIDVGGFGAYGEWHSEQGTSITVDNAERLTNAVLRDFPDQHVVLNAMDPRLVDPLLAMSPRLGLRTDCLGEHQMFSLIPSSAAGSPIAERWKTAPVMSEWCHTAATDTVKGAGQVQKYHVSTVSSGNTWLPYTSMSAAQQSGFRNATKYAGYRYGVTSVTVPTKVARTASSFTVKLALTNTGSAPTYDDWDPVLQVTTADQDPTRRVVLAQQTLPIRLSSILPGTRTFSVPTTIAAGLKPGSYRLRIVVRDPKDYLAPMYLSQSGRTDQGSYPLRSLTVS